MGHNSQPASQTDRHTSKHLDGKQIDRKRTVKDADRDKDTQADG
jgi:hypothetical protein